MKTMWMVAMLAALTTVSSGCARQWWTRGQACNTYPSATPDYAGTAPAVTQVEPQTYAQPYVPQPAGS